MIDLLILLLMLGSISFTFISAVGLIRLPDVYSRSHLATETDTLGAGLALAAVGLSMGIQAESIKLLFLLTFIFITNPTAAHAVARAALEDGIEPEKRVDTDES